MTSDTLKLFLTPEHDCSYMKGRKARSMFVNPATTITSELYSSLNQRGFRRSGKYLYKPHCESCNACIPSRVVVDQFKLNRSQRRVIKRNQDLTVKLLPSIADESIYDLYDRYICARHSDGDMYPPSRDQFRSFLVERLSSTFYIGFYLDEKLVCVSVIDHVDDGLSALYTFYDPEPSHRALGVNAILWQIQETQKMGLHYLYLGYWIAECQKMQYKSAYTPQELFYDDHWQAMVDVRKID